MSQDKSDSFFKNPHSHSTKLGKYDCTVEFVTSKEFPNTCAACSRHANTWNKDHQSLQNGEDNFTASLEKLLQLLDVFTKEKSKGNETAGHQHNYSLSNDCDFTILLLWQIRHVIVHNSSVIDNECKKKYEKIFRKKEKNTHPIIDLPETLEIGQEFEIQYENYKKVQDCFFNYIKRRATDKDYSVFMKRASFSNFRISGASISIPLEKGVLIFDIGKATEFGIDINLESGEVTPPDGTTYSFEDNQIHLKNGNSFPAKLIPYSEYDDIIAGRKSIY